MPKGLGRALAFIGGGLLEGVGKGLVLQGKEKRERALADLEHTRNLERDENKFEFRRGLLNTEIGARIEAAGVATGVAKTAATTLSGRQVERAATATGVASDVATTLSDRQDKRTSAATGVAADVATTKSKRDIAAAEKTTDVRKDAAKKLADDKVKAAEKAVDVAKDAARTSAGIAKTTADALAGTRTEAAKKLADVAKETAERADKAARKAAKALADAKVEAAKITAGKPTDTTSAEDRIIQRHFSRDENEIKAIDREGAATELEARGFKKAAQAQRRKAKAIRNQDIRAEAEAQADAEVEEKAGTFSTDAEDFKEDGGSRIRFRARRVREIIAERSGPYVGDTPPPGFPDAKRAKDGFWYVSDPDHPGKFKRVQRRGSTQATTAGTIIEITGTAEAQSEQLAAVPIGGKVRIRGVVYVKRAGGFEKVTEP